MSIEKRKPSLEFYFALDEVITHQVKSREAFDKAIKIGRKTSRNRKFIYDKQISKSRE